MPLLRFREHPQILAALYHTMYILGLGDRWGPFIPDILETSVLEFGVSQACYFY